MNSAPIDPDSIIAVREFIHDVRTDIGVILQLRGNDLRMKERVMNSVVSHFPISDWCYLNCQKIPRLIVAKECPLEQCLENLLKTSSLIVFTDKFLYLHAKKITTLFFDTKK